MSQLLQQALKAEEKEVVTTPEVSIESILLADEQNAHDLTVGEHSMEGLDNQIDLLTSAETSLEELHASMEAATAEGEAGIDRKTAQVYAIATKAILGDAVEQPIASMESFGGETQNLEAAQVSMEKVGQTLRLIWEAIQRAVMNALKAVSDFAAKLFSSTDALKKRADAAKTKIDGLKKAGVEAKSDKMNLPNASLLQMGGKVDTGVIDKGMKAVNNVLVANVGKVASIGEDSYGGIVNAIVSKKDIEAELAKTRAAGNEYTAKISAKTVGTELPGGKAFTSTIKTDERGDVTSMSVPKLVDYSKRVKFDGKAEVNTPSLDWASGLVENVLDLIKHLEGQKKAVDDLKKAREDVLAKAEGLAKDADAGKLEGIMTAAQVKIALRMANIDFNSTVSRANGYIFNYGRNLLSTAEAVANNYGEKKAS